MRNEWDAVLDGMNVVETSNQKRRQHTVDVNKLIFGANKLLLITYLDLVDDNKISIHDISWTMIEKQVSTSMNIKPLIVSSIRKQGIEEGILCNLPNELNNVVINAETISESQFMSFRYAPTPDPNLTARWCNAW